MYAQFATVSVDLQMSKRMTHAAPLCQDLSTATRILFAVPIKREGFISQYGVKNTINCIQRNQTSNISLVTIYMLCLYVK